MPCYYSNASLPDCLESLRGQTIASHEVIVVDSTPDDDSVLTLGAGDPRVRIHHHTSRLGAHAARNFGARLATGEYLAFLDPDMIAAPDWLAELDAAHRKGQAVVGGGVDCPPHYWARAVHVTKYGWWLTGGQPRERAQLPSGNLSLPRALFEEMGGFPDRFWEGDTELSYRLRARGYALWHVPAARTRHFDVPTWRGFLRERWLRGADTGQARRCRNAWPAIECWLRVAASPATWLVMMGRSAAHAFRSGWAAVWLASSPVVGIGLAAWIAGECEAFRGGKR